ncbi:hypothetical protein H0O00_03980 [Candidatus Micrarchaeota archaeon]|nr:hypothetical protein [Candidatus Micrarchaeota archaeon]
MTRKYLYTGMEGVNLKTGKPIKFSIPSGMSKHSMELLEKNVQVTIPESVKKHCGGNVVDVLTPLKDPRANVIVYIGTPQGTDSDSPCSQQGRKEG